MAKMPTYSLFQLNDSTAVPTAVYLLIDIRSLAVNPSSSWTATIRTVKSEVRGSMGSFFSENENPWRKGSLQTTVTSNDIHTATD
jgi:hypothetical protein